MKFATPLGLFLTAAVLMAAPGDRMSAAQQNALVQKYCAVCHTDAARNGALTLEHFDASQVDPSLAEMLVSKLKTGAFGAAGVPLPDPSTRRAFIDALTEEAAGSHAWTVRQLEDITTASIVGVSGPTFYRLVTSCNAGSHYGEMQLSWSPVSKTGTLFASTDGKAARTYTVEGEEQMGNGTPGKMGPAAVMLSPAPTLPTKTLIVSNLSPGESVVFPFATLPQGARQALSTCFPGQ